MLQSRNRSFFFSVLNILDFHVGGVVRLGSLSLFSSIGFFFNRVLPSGVSLACFGGVRAAWRAVSRSFGGAVQRARLAAVHFSPVHARRRPRSQFGDRGPWNWMSWLWVQGFWVSHFGMSNVSSVGFFGRNPSFSISAFRMNHPPVSF